MRQYPANYLKSLDERVGSLFNQLKATLGARMKAALWLDTESRNAALEKLRVLRGQFITWPMFSNNSFVASLMEDVRNSQFLKFQVVNFFHLGSSRSSRFFR